LKPPADATLDEQGSNFRVEERGQLHCSSHQPARDIRGITDDRHQHKSNVEMRSKSKSSEYCFKIQNLSYQVMLYFASAVHLGPDGSGSLTSGLLRCQCVPAIFIKMSGRDLGG
jgi:hypothetical protein